MQGNSNIKFIYPYLSFKIICRNELNEYSKITTPYWVIVV